MYISSYRVWKDTGGEQSGLNRLRSGGRQISKLEFATAERLSDY